MEVTHYTIVTSSSDPTGVTHYTIVTSSSDPTGVTQYDTRTTNASPDTTKLLSTKRQMLFDDLDINYFKILLYYALLPNSIIIYIY